MGTTLHFSVGSGGVNMHEDVVNVQRFLNAVPGETGAARHPLPVTGIFTQSTQRALNALCAGLQLAGPSDPIQKKHIAGLKWQTESGPVAPSVSRTALLPGGLDLDALSNRLSALINEVGFPALDAGSKDPASLGIQFTHAARTRWL
jgi:hypothetical protein